MRSRQPPLTNSKFLAGSFRTHDYQAGCQQEVEPLLHTSRSRDRLPKRSNSIPFAELKKPFLGAENPPENINPAHFAATEDCPWRRKIMRGEVHDENAYALGGYSGHAGLFGTAEADLQAALAGHQEILRSTAGPGVAADPGGGTGGSLRVGACIGPRG